MLAAFDIETARLIDPIDPKTSLGVCCLAEARDGEAPLVFWCSGGRAISSNLDSLESNLGSNPPDDSFSQKAIRRLVISMRDIREKRKTNYYIGWNSLGFDWRVLATESGLPSECKKLALNHIDLMFVFLSKQGHRLSLRNAADGIGLHKGIEGIEDGAAACDLWKSGEYEKVLRYCAQDAIITLELAKHALNGGFPWKTKSGVDKQFTLKIDSPDDLLVSSVIKWPELPRPLVDRSECWRWLNES